MVAVMSRRLHYLVNQLRSVFLHNSEQRLAAYLLENYDPEERDRPVARIPARRSELALMPGSDDRDSVPGGRQIPAAGFGPHPRPPHRRSEPRGLAGTREPSAASGGKSTWGRDHPIAAPA